MKIRYGNIFKDQNVFVLTPSTVFDVDTRELTFAWIIWAVTLEFEV